MEAFVGESIIGYDEIKKVVDIMEKCVCKIKLNTNRGFTSFTGFFCKIPFPNDINKKFPVLITVNHFIRDGNFSEKTEKILTLTIGDKLISLNLKDRIKHYSDKYNIFIVEIKQEDLIENYLEFI